MIKSRSIAAVGAMSTLGLLLTASAQAAGGLGWTAVPDANTKAPGVTVPNKLSPQLAEVAVAQGATVLENPRDGIGYYGYDSVNGNPPLLPVAPSTTEAHKTEPDKNTYLTLRGQKGPDAGYDYGTHFLFQGHESGTPGYVTRVNLDADAAHRVTLMSTKDMQGNPLPDFDGSTWDPFAKRLLFTAEDGCDGGVWQGRAGYRPDARLQGLTGSLGQGGYEGVQVASNGNVWLVEDVGGSVVGNTNAKVPNSYVYRFVPTTKSDLTAGRLEALQVLRRNGTPMQTKAHPFGADLKNLHTYGKSFRTRWVTVHDTAKDGTTSFCATTAAESAHATPFKRPENGMFRPGTGFKEFYFTETGDTNADSTANAAFGGWGGVFRLHQHSPSSRTGRLSLAFRGDKQHTGLDNLSFASRDSLLVVEDAGDTLHEQRNALDSGFVINVAQSRPRALRFLAEGRDPSATIDSALGDSGTAGFDNDGDNEITGIHVSDGDPTIGGLLGTKVPTLFKGWRAFWTQQHGDNVTYELIRAPHGS